MESNGPTRCDKFAWAWAKSEDITKRGKWEERGEERGGRGGEGRR